jgi:hypothetical protein
MVLRRIASGLRSLFRKKQVDQEFTEELGADLQMSSRIWAAAFEPYHFLTAPTLRKVGCRPISKPFTALGVDADASLANSL